MAWMQLLREEKEWQFCDFDCLQFFPDFLGQVREVTGADAQAAG